MADERQSDWITAELRRAAVTERAPSHLRLQIDELSRQQSRRPSRRFVLIPAVGLIAALALVLILALPGGTPGGPTVAQAAVLSETSVGVRSTATLATSESTAQEYARFAAVRFPGELKDGTWRFRASRVVLVGGRRMLVIDYANGRQRITYSVVATLLHGQKSGFHSLQVNGHTVVSWQESRHSCLLTSTTASRSTLLTLARS